ncbi:MAG TPA: 4-hydroxybenzoate octaprenyltransferase [Xanthomonadales bacterium]|nr:4-hydroxybenzoate octaprenyltransferase [Xanthomonadales bacterium]
MALGAWNAYWRLMRFDRPIGMLLLLWPTWWALLIAGQGLPSFKNIVIFTLGVVLMRAAGCVMNDIADRNFDPHVARTRNRPLASGELSVRQALGCFVLLLMLAFLLVLQTNRLTILLSFVGLALAATYPFFKRYTHLPQVVLGFAFSWGIPMAFAAETGSLPGLAWALLLVNLNWVLVYDTLYAMVDREDDLKIGVKSTAILFGRHDLQVISGLMLLLLVLLTALGLVSAWSWPYFVAVALVAALFGWQRRLIRLREPAACFRAFLHNNWVGLAIFLGLAGHYLLAGPVSA